MTGDVFRGHLLDGFFNLAGALTGQGILLVGMMTEAVVTPVDQRPRPGPAERALRAGRGRRRCTRTSVPLPTGSSPSGHARCWGSPSTCSSGSRATPTLRHGPLLDAIADGTFGLMKRPSDAGRGLDGVAPKADGYYNPATEILEAKS